MFSDGQDFEEALTSGHITGSTFGRAFDVAQTAAMWRFLFPFWKQRRFLKVGHEKELSTAVKVLDKFAFDLIKDRRAEGTPPRMPSPGSSIFSPRTLRLLTRFVPSSLSSASI